MPYAQGQVIHFKQSNYDDKRITGQACLADDW